VTTERIAIISNIHANSWALKAVVKDIKGKNGNEILNLGDSLYGPLDPQGTFDVLLEHNIKSIAGNQDRLITENAIKNSSIPTLEFVKNSIDTTTLNWLKKLPFDLRHKNIYCCHGTPNNDSMALMEKITMNHVGVQTNEEIEYTLSRVMENIVVCGHSHLPRTIKTKNKIIINPGSVGLPAYSDTLPVPHKMESLSAHAKYAIIDINPDGINIELNAIAYDYEAAAHAAEINNREDWAKWIRTGRI